MSLVLICIIFLIVVCLAVLYSMVGLGGGSVYVPVLILAGIDFHQASATSLFMVVIASLGAALFFSRKRMVDWNLLFAIVPLAIIGSFAGGFVASLISASILKIVFALVLIFTAFLMFRPAREGQKPTFMSIWGNWERSCGGYNYGIPIGFLVPAAGLAGFVSGLIGVGGGIFMLPMLILLSGCPTRVAIGVSSAYVGLIALPGFIGHLAGGTSFDVRLALPLGAAALIGASIGPFFSLKASTARLRIILAFVLLAMAVWMIVNFISQ